MSDALALPVARAKVQGDRWRAAYMLALGNSAIFFVLTGANYFFGAASAWSFGFAELLFFAGAMVSGVSLVRGGGELAAVSAFVIGTGIYFGFGTYDGIASDLVGFARMFSPDDQLLLRAKVDFLNALSVLIALGAAWPLCRVDYTQIADRPGLRQTIAVVLPYRAVLLVAAVPAFIAILLLTFPVSENPIVRSTLALSTALIYSTLALCGMQWSALNFYLRAVAMTVLIGMTGIGLLSLAKSGTVFPILAFCAGLMFDAKSRKLLFFLLAVSVLSYFTFVATICNSGRAHPLYNADGLNSLSERVQIISDTSTVVAAVASQAPDENGGQDQRLGAAEFLLERVEMVLVQAFIVREYDEGRPGSSMRDILAVFVPRILWPDKPEITIIGRELDALVFNRNVPSALAPTYSAEGYWDFGWPGVVMVSLLMGLEIGWLTRKWQLFLQYGARRIGILIFSIPILVAYAQIENFVVPSYVGGFFSIFVLIEVVDAIARQIFPAGPARAEARP